MLLSRSWPPRKRRATSPNHALQDQHGQGSHVSKGQRTASFRCFFWMVDSFFGLQQFFINSYRHPQNMRNWICFFSSDIKEYKHLDAQMPPTSKVWLYMAPFADQLFWEWCLPHNFSASHQLIIQDQHPVEILYTCSREKLWQNSEKTNSKKNITVDIRDFDFAYITASCGVFLFQLPIICRVLQRQCQFLCSSMQIQGSIHLSWATKLGLILLMVQTSGDHQLIWRNLPLFTGFYKCQVVQDFFHQ